VHVSDHSPPSRAKVKNGVALPSIYIAVKTQHNMKYSIYYGNKSASSSSSLVSDVNRYAIIRELLDSVFNTLLVFIHWWKIQTSYRAFLL
jgi:hypothetical protein